jgi:anti-anti-sigma factor
MLIITKIEGHAGAVVLRLEGRIAGPWAEEARKSIESNVVEGRVVKLDLEGVSFADASGIKLLLELRSRGVSLMGCSAFVEAQLATGPG